jgi:SAM-dependent methyltransferase
MVDETSGARAGEVIAYSDGAAVESRIFEILRTESDVCSSRAIRPDLYGEWAFRYHLTPERANLVRHLTFDGLEVLELGAGMGGVSRFIAERARQLAVVEGAERRYRCLQERLKGLTNWSGQVGNFQELRVERRFDVVCLIGVLEYSELYLRPPGYRDSPFRWLLERCASILGEEGALVLAIENQLGLKYWNGGGEDHTGRTYDGICGYPVSPSPKTFSRRVLKETLRAAGFGSVDEYFPFPDYKVPSTVLSAALCDEDPALCAELAGARGSENYTGPRRLLFPEPLAFHSLAKAGLLPELANSFLYVACRKPESRIRRSLQDRMFSGGEVGWHYSPPSRRVPTRTVFLQGGRFRKEARPGERWSADAYDVAAGGAHCRGAGMEASALARGESLRESLLRRAYYGDWEGFLGLLDGFVAWSLDRWRAGETPALLGRALDALVVNARIAAGGSYELFDLEWEWPGAVEPSWFVLRNALVLRRDAAMFSGAAPIRNARALYEEVCRRRGLAPATEADIARESLLQSIVMVEPREVQEARIRAELEQPYGEVEMPRDPGEHLALLGELDRLRARLRELETLLATPPHHLARFFDDRTRGIPWLRRAAAGTYGGLLRAYRAWKGRPPGGAAGPTA